MLLHDIDSLEITLSKKQKDIISLINKFRKDNNVNELIYDIIIGFKDLIFDKSSELIFYNNQNFFKLSNGKYLIKIPIEEFEARFYNKEKNITNYLLNDNLNKICIIEKDNILFILLFHDNSIKFLNNGGVEIEIEILSESISYPK